MGGYLTFDSDMRAFTVFLILLVSSKLCLAQTGFIEISGDPGFSVFLGDEPKGVLADTPLMLSDIKTGEHKLSFFKQGYKRVDHNVVVSKNSVAQISITADEPVVDYALTRVTKVVSQKKVGVVDITTWPPRCNLEIVGKRWAKSELVKNGSTFRVKNLPEGIYKIVATAKGIQAQGELEIVDGKLSACFMNLEESKFIDLNKEMTKVEQAELMAEKAINAANKATEERLATEKAARSSKEENERLRQELERLKAKAKSAPQGGKPREMNEEVSIQEWVGIYVATSESNIIANHEKLWADVSDYQYIKGGGASRRQVISSIQQNIKRWPIRRTSLVEGSLHGRDNGDTAIISFQMDYFYKSESGKTTSGSTLIDMTVRRVGKSYQIIKWRERVAR